MSCLSSELLGCRDDYVQTHNSEKGVWLFCVSGYRCIKYEFSAYSERRKMIAAQKCMVA